MKTQRFGISLILLSLCAVPATHAQYARPELSARAMLRVGLEPQWSSAISTGYGGKVTGATIHISPTETYQVVQVTDRLGRTTYFSERDFGPGGTVLGMDQASRLAELAEAELKARGLEPKVEVKSVPDITLYVRTSLGTVIALDAETGREKWTTQAGVRDYPNYPVAADDELLVTISGSTLYVLDAASGRVVESKRLMGVPAARPSLYNGLVYAPTLKGLVEVYDLNNLNKLIYTLGSGGRIRQPLTVAPESISWTTDRGYIYVSHPGEPGIRYRFQAFDSFSTAPVRHENMLIATSMDGSVYAIDERSGQVTWRYSVGEPIGTPPVAIDDSLFIISDSGQMLCLDGTEGTLRWSTSEIESFLAASSDRLYCVATGQRLTVLDRATGRRLAEMQLGQEILPIMNRKTDRVYFVSNGTLRCLAEPGLRYPLTRIDPVEPSPEQAGEPQDTLAGPPQPAATKPPPSTTAAPIEDPFGDAPGDPFLQPEPEDEPVPEQEPFEGEDPFGIDPFGEENPFGDGSSEDDAGGSDSTEDESFGDGEENPFESPF